MSGGTGYNTATGQLLSIHLTVGGTGLTVNITASGGVITAVAINVDGSGYAVGETITITGGGGNATIDVSAVVEMAIGDTTLVVHLEPLVLLLQLEPTSHRK